MGEIAAPALSQQGLTLSDTAQAVWRHSATLPPSPGGGLAVSVGCHVVPALLGSPAFDGRNDEKGHQGHGECDPRINL